MRVLMLGGDQLYEYVLPHRVLKTGIDFDNLGQKLGTVLRKPLEHINIFLFSSSNWRYGI